MIMDTIKYVEHQVKRIANKHFIHLIEIALADGKIDKKETALLHHLGINAGFTHSQIDSIIDSTCKSVYNPPDELSKRFEQFYEIIKMVLADGVIDKNEMRLANTLAAKSGFHESEIPNLLVLLIRGIKENKKVDELYRAYKRSGKAKV